MDPLWLLEGGLDAPGWKDLEKDSREDAIAMVCYDRAAWALVEAAEAPTKYEGLVPKRPDTGLYVSEQGQPIYVVSGVEVSGPLEVLKTLGEKAERMLEELGDPIVVLQRMGKTY
jgi:hypothetical protein